MSDFEFQATVILVVIGFYLFMRHVIGLSKGGSILAIIVALFGSLVVFGSREEKGEKK